VSIFFVCCFSDSAVLWLGHWTCNLVVASSIPGYGAVGLPYASCSHPCASVTKQYKSAPV